MRGEKYLQPVWLDIPLSRVEHLTESEKNPGDSFKYRLLVNMLTTLALSQCPARLNTHVSTEHKEAVNSMIKL